MKTWRTLLLTVLLVASACGGPPAKRITAAAGPSPSASAEPSPSPSPEPSPSPSPVPAPSPSPVPSPTKAPAKAPPKPPAPSPTVVPSPTVAPTPTAPSYGGTQGTWGCSQRPRITDLLRHFDCSGMTPAGQGTWTCLEDAAPTRKWTCSGETGLGQGTWTWTQRGETAWDGWPPDILPKKQAMDCSGGTSDRYLLRCNFYPTGESRVSFIEYLYTGDLNYARTTAIGDAGFGPATWSCAQEGNRIDCSGQVGFPYITSPLPILQYALRL